MARQKLGWFRHLELRVMHYKITMLIVIGLYFLEQNVVSVPDSDLSTNEQTSEHNLDIYTLEPIDFSTSFNFSNYESGFTDINDKLQDSSSRIIVDETTMYSTSFTSSDILTSTSKGAGEIEKVNISELRTILGCVDYALCSNNKAIKLPNCYCDPLCLLYDDCCIDYHEANPTSHDTFLEHTEKSTPRWSENSYRYTEIETFQTFTSCSVWCYGWNLIGYQFVSSCPGETDANLVDLCVHNDIDVPMTMIPVVGANGIHFRNKFCAECHNISMIKYWKLIIEGVAQISISQSEPTKEMLFHAFTQLHCKSLVIPPDNEEIRHCVKASDTPEYGVEKSSFQLYNKIPYINREQICRRYRVPVYYLALQQKTNKTVTKFNRVAFVKNSGCLPPSFDSYACPKRSDISISDIVSRHLYDKYSLSVLFHFDHTLQQDTILCEKNKLMLTFLVRNCFTESLPPVVGI